MSETAEKTEWISVNEAAAICDVYDVSIRRWIHAGHIKAKRTRPNGKRAGRPIKFLVDYQTLIFFKQNKHLFLGPKALHQVNTSKGGPKNKSHRRKRKIRTNPTEVHKPKAFCPHGHEIVGLRDQPSARYCLIGETTLERMGRPEPAFILAFRHHEEPEPRDTFTHEVDRCVRCTGNPKP